jgi:hypothetical protein
VQLAVLPVALGIAAPIGGRLLGRVGAGPLTVGGLMLAAAGAFEIVLRHGTVGLLVGLMLIGLGLGAFIPANNATVMSASPPGHAGVVSGILNMTRGIGTALGVAVAGASTRPPGRATASRSRSSCSALARLRRARRSGSAAGTTGFGVQLRHVGGEREARRRGRLRRARGLPGPDQSQLDAIRERSRPDVDRSQVAPEGGRIGVADPGQIVLGEDPIQLHGEVLDRDQP